MGLRGPHGRTDVVLEELGHQLGSGLQPLPELSIVYSFCNSLAAFGGNVIKVAPREA